jgi:hypothetical protein
MPKFKYSDEVIYSDKSRISPLEGQTGIIVSIDYSNGAHNVHFEKLARCCLCSEVCLTLVSSPSAMARPGEAGLIASVIQDADRYCQGYQSVVRLIKKDLNTKTCDCGGFKTYQSMEPENHSSWCSSRSK